MSGIMPLIVRRKDYQPAPPPAPRSAPNPLLGKTVSVMQEGARLFGQVDAVDADGKATVKLAIPVAGVLALTNTKEVFAASALTEVEMPTESRRVEFENRRNLLEESAAKGVAVTDANGKITDYTNVTIKGYASTWEHITPSDRQGDAVRAGAFKNTIRKFMENPVMLIDHRMSVEHMAGHYTVVREDETGLYIEGKVSDAPELRKVRFMLMEKSLRTVSIGGIWLYEPDGRTISGAHLFEISLVAVPANPDAQIGVRSLNLNTIKSVCQL